jgi:uncharacterized damage-inducible protein DinB
LTFEQPPHDATDERSMLVAWLDLYRDIMVYKVEGLTEEQARIAPTPNGVPLLNLIAHLTGVERGWFEMIIAGREIERDRPGEFGQLSVTVPDAITAYRDQCRRSNEVMQEVASLDERCRGRWPARGDTYTVRWVLQHMLEETARHAGHADITRELIDGSVGYSRLERD